MACVRKTWRWVFLISVVMIALRMTIFYLNYDQKSYLSIQLRGGGRNGMEKLDEDDLHSRDLHMNNVRVFEKYLDMIDPLGEDVDAMEDSPSKDLDSRYLSEKDVDFLAGKNANVVKELRERWTRVEEHCRHHSTSCHLKSTVFYRMYFFHGYSTSICTIAKAGSSTWRDHLRRVNGGPPATLPVDEDPIRKQLLAQPLNEVERVLNTSARIITVRHPLTRLVSAYRQKYKNGRKMKSYSPDIERRQLQIMYIPDWRSRIHQFWVPALASNGLLPPDLHLKLGLQVPFDPTTLYSTETYMKLHKLLRLQVTFEQFLRHVIASFRAGTPDAHWSSYVHECCVCRLHYQFVTKVETLEQDLSTVFSLVNLPADPRVVKNKLRSSVSNLYGDFRYFESVPAEVKKEIYNIYKYDFEFFDYELPENFKDVA